MAFRSIGLPFVLLGIREYLKISCWRLTSLFTLDGRPTGMEAPQEQVSCAPGSQLNHLCFEQCMVDTNDAFTE